MSINIALSNYNAQLAYSRMNSFVNSFSTPITTKSNTYEGITDSIKLSARSISAFSREWIKGQLDKVATTDESGSYKSVDQISLEHAENIAGFADNVRKLLYGNQISLDEEVSLQTDGIGHIVATSSGSNDADEVNSALRSSIGITNGFMSVAASESIVNHVNQFPDFIEDYAADPQDTLNRNENSLRSYVLKMELTVGQDYINTAQAEPLYS